MNSPTENQFGRIFARLSDIMLFKRPRRKWYILKHILRSYSLLVINAVFKFIKRLCSYSDFDQEPPRILSSCMPHPVPTSGTTTYGPSSGSGSGSGPGVGLSHQSSSLASGLPTISGYTPPQQLSIAQTSAQLPAGFPILSDAVDGLVAVSSRESQRYDRRVKLKKVPPERFLLPPAKTSYQSPPTPPGWMALRHPEGALYFIDTNRHILTDAYLHDTTVLDTIEDYISQIFKFMGRNNLEMPHEAELVLEPRRSGKYGYYFADHKKRVLFWLDEYDATDLSDEVRVVFTDSLLSHEIESQYWYHNELYPHSRNISWDDIRQVQDILIHAIGDSLTSLVSTAPYGQDELQKMLSLTHDIEDHINNHSPGSACIIYRLLGTLTHERFNNLYGQRGARLSRTQSIHGEATRPRGYLLLILDPVFFFAPSLHLGKLEKICIDSFVNMPSWTHHRELLTDEWKEFTLYATVLLNANVAFLAIQSVDTSPIGHRSPAQRASYFSIAASIGAILLGLFMARQHHDSNTLMMSFLANRSYSALGLETLSLIYSLPYCLLMWAMLSFLIAFSCMCYSTGDIATYLVVGTSWFVLALLIAWCISTSFENEPYRSPFFKIQTIVNRRLGYIMKGKLGRIMSIKLGPPNPSQV